ncbi:MAG: aspartate/glutamate racemase family protein [Candidatus Limnocylindrales bacterium]
MTERQGEAAGSADASRPRTVGIVGGMGPLATADFYRRMVEATQAGRDQDHLRVIIDSHPQIPDRSGVGEPGAGDESPIPHLIESIDLLQRAGAELLVMACNAAYAFLPDLVAAASVPIIDWPGEAARGVRQRQPGLTTIGVLATDGTLAHGLYQQAFRALGIAVLPPAEGAQRRVMAVIYGPDGVKAGGPDQARLRRELQAITADLARRGADAVLLACTELSVLDAAYPMPWPLPVWDAADIVARRTVRLAGATLRERPNAPRRPIV